MNPNWSSRGSVPFFSLSISKSFRVYFLWGFYNFFNSSYRLALVGSSSNSYFLKSSSLYFDSFTRLAEPEAIMYMNYSLVPSVIILYPFTKTFFVMQSKNLVFRLVVQLWNHSNLLKKSAFSRFSPEFAILWMHYSILATGITKTTVIIPSDRANDGRNPLFVINLSLPKRSLTPNFL